NFSVDGHAASGGLMMSSISFWPALMEVLSLTTNQRSAAELLREKVMVSTKAKRWLGFIILLFSELKNPPTLSEVDMFPGGGRSLRRHCKVRTTERGNRFVLFLRQGVNQQTIALFIAEDGVAAGRYRDILGAVDLIADWRRVDAGIGTSLPQQLAVAGIIGIE